MYILWVRRPQPIPGAPGSAPASGLPPGWSESTDPSSGRTYYVHVDGKTSWEFPKPGDAPAKTLPPGWTEANDPATGRKYYVNSTTNATSWEFPTEGRV